MKRSTGPWVGLAVIGLVVFLVWLSMQMSRTDRADRILLTLAGCGLLVAVAAVAGAVGRRRR